MCIKYRPEILNPLSQIYKQFKSVYRTAAKIENSLHGTRLIKANTTKADNLAKRREHISTPGLKQIHGVVLKISVFKLQR